MLANDPLAAWASPDGVADPPELAALSSEQTRRISPKPESNREIIRPSRTGIIFAAQDDNLLPVRRSKASTYFALVFSIISDGK
jgi:hypothetical protein